MGCVAKVLSSATLLPSDSLRNQCDFLEKSRLKMLRSQDGKKPPTREALLSSMAGQVVTVSSLFDPYKMNWCQDGATVNDGLLATPPTGAQHRGNQADMPVIRAGG